MPFERQYSKNTDKRSKIPKGIPKSHDIPFQDYIKIMESLERSYQKNSKSKGVIDRIDRTQRFIEDIASGAMRQIGVVAISILKKLKLDNADSGAIYVAREVDTTDSEGTKKSQPSSPVRRIPMTLNVMTEMSLPTYNFSNVSLFEGTGLFIDRTQNLVERGVSRVAKYFSKTERNKRELERVADNSVFEQREYLRSYLERQAVQLVQEYDTNTMFLGKNRTDKYGFPLDILNLPAKYRSVLTSYLNLYHPSDYIGDFDFTKNGINRLFEDGVLVDQGGNIYLNTTRLISLKK